ncbi:MAG: phosphodiesterase [Acidimicrobiales bacterium]
MLIAQITDFHIVEAGSLMNDRVDTAGMLRAAVAHINAMTPRPDVVIATGDLVNNGRPAQYTHLREILGDLDSPLLAIPGNHDDRTLLRETLPDSVPAGGSDDRVDYLDDSWELRLVGLDTTIPGANPGHVVADQMEWLEHVLAEAPDRPTLIYQHHPPFLTGIAWMDDVALAGRELEAEVVARHPQVEGVVCGHIHRVVQTRFANTVASTWPSTGAQVALALDGTRFGYTDEPGVVALHQWTPSDGLVSHLSYVDGPPVWIPSWAADG